MSVSIDFTRYETILFMVSMVVLEGRTSRPRNIQATVARIKQEKPKPKLLQPRGVATSGEVAHAYLAYSVLSGAAAHPTFEALDRHLSKGEDGVTAIDVQPVARPGELAETTFLACAAMLGALVITNQALGPLQAEECLPALADEFRRIGDVGRPSFHIKISFSDWRWKPASSDLLRTSESGAHSHWVKP